MKKIIIISLLLCATAFAEQANFDPFPKNKGTIYEYGDNIPDVCFFPIDKARWNGYEVTVTNWSQLTDYQKISFISEGAEEIERNEGVNVDIGDGWRLLIAINGGVDSLPKDSNIAMINFLYDLLKLSNFKVPEDTAKKT
jgi:hypothetical protein